MQNSFLKRSFMMLFLRISGLFLLFGFTVFLTKFYTPKIIGQYDFVRSFLLAIGSICLLGFDQSILYFRGRLSDQSEIGEIKNIYKKMVTMLFVTSLIVLLTIVLIPKEIINSYFSDQEVYSLFFKGAAALFFHGLFILNTEVIRALDKIYVAELFRNILKYIPLIIGATVLFYFHKEDYLINVFLAGFVLLSIISSAMVFIYFRKIQENNTVKISHKEVFFKSYPIAISAMGMFLLLCFDIMFLKKYRNDETVAFYSVGVKLMTVISVIIVTVNTTVSAKIAEYFATQNIVELNKTVTKSVRLIFGITVPAVIVLCFFSTQILSFFGHQYIAAQKAFLILLMGQGICSAFGTASVYLNMTGRQHLFQLILIGAVLINLILNRFLIPIYGMTGAAIAFVSSSFFWNFTSAIIIYKRDKVKVFLS